LVFLVSLLVLWVFYRRPLAVKGTPLTGGKRPGPAPGATESFYGVGLARNCLWKPFLLKFNGTLVIDAHTLSLGAQDSEHVLEREGTECVVIHPGFYWGLRFIPKTEGFPRYLLFITRFRRTQEIVAALLARGYAVYAGQGWPGASGKSGAAPDGPRGSV